MEDNYFEEFENELSKCFNQLDQLKTRNLLDTLNESVYKTWEGFAKEKIRPLQDKYNLTDFQITDLYVTIDLRFEQYLSLAF